MFDHVKCVVGWTTMACHVYDLIYYKVMTIVICDIQSKDIKLQQIMWTKLNEMMLKKRLIPKLKFKGFMTNKLIKMLLELFMVG